MLYEEFNAELTSSISNRKRSRMFTRYSEYSAHHRKFASRYNSIGTNFLQEKHGISTVQLVAQLYLGSTEFLLSGQTHKRELTIQLLEDSLQRVDGVYFRHFLKNDVGWQTVAAVMQDEIKLCRRISNGDSKISRRFPVLTIITGTVDNFIAEARELMRTDDLAEADVVERGQYIESVIKVNRGAHPIPYPKRCEILLKSVSVKSLKHAKALQTYTDEQAALFLDMEIDSFLTLYSGNVTPSVLDKFFEKTNFRDRRLRERNFLPNDVTGASIIAANVGPTHENQYDESKIESVIKKEQEKKVLYGKFDSWNTRRGKKI